MYVDDVLSGANTLSLAQSKAEQLNSLLMAGGFRLHKWVSNDPAVLTKVEDARIASTAPRAFLLDALPRALGLAWNPRDDFFIFQLNLPRASTTLTKRVVLSRVAQLFDPLGWIAPIIVVAKIFLQGLWKLQMPWDQPLPAPWAQRWLDFEAELNALSSISLSRWLGIHPSASMEIHGFSDASNAALGAVLYLRCITIEGQTTVSLITGKSKVAPLKRTTIPRLELSAALLLSRLLSQVRTTLQLSSTPAHLWTDSSVVLAWLQGHPSRWRDFVANRVVAIHDLAPDASWHHVSGTDNPADCASRDLSPRELLTHRLWWDGPPWLSSHLASWNTAAPPPDGAVDLEERPARPCHANVTRPGALWELVFRYSKFMRLIRITA
ncbi:uncharacterized protein LOC105198158 [Solenopsis invicta]|uniref:uncharacterized protein LOC105198158 n=1 Tax=Solenopsis invicta TaxID=13686 RepID=UPI000595B499|nr:uncharacterized protein LOC105198158 [Solenopsis invicta]